MEAVLKEIAEEGSAELLASLGRINATQEDVLGVLATLGRALDCNFGHDGALFAQRGDGAFLDLEHYRAKIGRLKKAVLHISDRTRRLQGRLNAVRKQCPKNRTHIVQKGPFYYRCVYPGGVRYRELPSSSAKYIPSGAVIAHDATVAVAERIFINGEASVFLHVHGVGWLMENKGDLVCMEMCGLHGTVGGGTGAPLPGVAAAAGLATSSSASSASTAAASLSGSSSSSTSSSSSSSSSPPSSLLPPFPSAAGAAARLSDGTGAEATDDGLPPLPLKEHRRPKVPIKLGFAAYEETEEEDDEHDCFRDRQW